VPDWIFSRQGASQAARSPIILKRMPMVADEGPTGKVFAYATTLFPVRHRSSCPVRRIKRLADYSYVRLERTVKKAMTK
jgi:hypothetical protein